MRDSYFVAIVIASVSMVLTAYLLSLALQASRKGHADVIEHVDDDAGQRYASRGNWERGLGFVIAAAANIAMGVAAIVESLRDRDGILIAVALAIQTFALGVLIVSDHRARAGMEQYDRDVEHGIRSADPLADVDADEPDPQNGDAG